MTLLIRSFIYLYIFFFSFFSWLLAPCLCVGFAFMVSVINGCDSYQTGQTRSSKTPSMVSNRATHTNTHKTIFNSLFFFLRKPSKVQTPVREEKEKKKIGRKREKPIFVQPIYVIVNQNRLIFFFTKTIFFLNRKIRLLRVAYHNWCDVRLFHVLKRILWYLLRMTSVSN